MSSKLESLVGLNSAILAAALMLLPASGVVNPSEPTHWMALALIWALGHAALEPERFRRRFVPDASPLALAGIRVWVCSIFLIYVLVSDLSRTARLPREMLAISAGRMDWLHGLPGFDSFLTSELALAAYEAWAALVLLAAAAGFLTRVSVPLATLSTLFYVGIFWDYTYFYHQCLIGLYVMTALSFTPCGDALSLDAWLRTRKGQAPVARSAAVYGWSRYLCWTALALPYFLAGLSKLRNGGWMWWEPMNLRGKIYRDSLQKGVFEPALGLHFFDAPDAMFAAIGIVTLILEVGFFMVLFSRRARSVLPVGAASMHLGIFTLQNFLFVDALLMQAIFYDWRRAGAWVRERFARMVAPAGQAKPAGRTYPVFVADAAFVICFVWLVHIESYPFSSWGMYSNKRLGTEFVYHVTWAEHAAEGRIPAPYEKCFPAPTFNPYLRMPAYAFQDPARQDASRRFFLACGEELNRGKPAHEHITVFRMERWLWDPVRDPAGPPYGEMTDVREVRVDVAEAAVRP